MMNMQKIEDLTKEYGEKLDEQYFLKRDLAELEESLETMRSVVLNDAYNDGLINGKNKQIRDTQEAAVLSENDELSDIEYDIKVVGNKYDRATASVKATEAKIGMLKAWMYSQAKIG